MRGMSGLLLLGLAINAYADVPYKRYCTEQVCVQRHEYAGIRVKDVNTYQTEDGVEHRIFRFDDGSVASLHLSPLPSGTCRQSKAEVVDVASGIAAGQGCLKSNHGMTDVAISIVVRASDLDTKGLTRRAGFWLWRVGYDGEGNYHERASDVLTVRFNAAGAAPD